MTMNVRRSILVVTVLLCACCCCARPAGAQGQSAYDFNGDGLGDILWRNTTTGDVSMWFLDGTNIVSATDFYSGLNLNWQIVGTGAFNNDGDTDILLR